MFELEIVLGAVLCIVFVILVILGNLYPESTAFDGIFALWFYSMIIWCVVMVRDILTSGLSLNTIWGL